MNDSGGSHERLARALLRFYPAAFRSRFGDDLVQLIGDVLRDARVGRAGASGVAMTWLKVILDVVVTAPAEHVDQRRVANSLSRPASAATIALGIAGIGGGFALVAAFLPHLPWSAETFNLRLVVFGGGAIAVAAAILRFRPAASRLIAPLALFTIVANVGHIAMVVLALDRPRFPEPDPEFRLLADYVAAAMWLGDAALGFVAWRIGGLARWAGMALGIGSLFAFSGMARLGLFDGAYSWFFNPASQIGIALNGIGWILLGVAVATRRRPRVVGAGITTAPKET